MYDSENGVRRALTFFIQSGLTRLLEKLRAKYIAEGQVRGQVVLEETTLGERREIASFLGKPPFRDATLRIRLSEMDQALRNSGFACSLLDVIIAFRPDESLETRPQRRAAHALHQSDFRQALLSLSSEFATNSRTQFWLLHGSHGLEWLFTRYKNSNTDEQQHQMRIIRYVASLLDQLPRPSSPERLALFAQRTSGDPHTLDANRAEGRLFLLALSDLFADAVPAQNRAHALHLYNAAGLLVDTISSSVAVFNLASAITHSGNIDPLLQAAGARVMLLPQRQLLEWSQVRPMRTDIYALENPQVFEEIVDDLLRLDTHMILPTLVCTAGWPSVATLLLLDQLLAASPENRLYYSGDFDLKGLQIAVHLLAHYPERCLPWRFDPEAYALALQSDGVPAHANELSQLNGLPPVFAPLIAIMQEKKKWAYQEGIANILIQDISDVTA
ncbi:MAG: TIGR02679 family protein [Ktedonobacteraceae bacterium]|nr:TIGR02679 family protein [Ktedonobacteraceae bacterium]